MADTQKRVGIVLPAGGARAAYQVGVLKFVGEAFPNLNPRIFAGISAGSINSCFLAQGDPFPKATSDLAALWEQLEFHQVLQTNFRSISSMALRWMYDLFLSKFTKRLLLKSLLDASPLAGTLLTHIHFWKISRAVRDGRIDGVAVTATNYHNGMTSIFYHARDDAAPWHREQRTAIPTAIRVRHVMASCSIPVLFEPIRIGDYLYGDGSLRFNFPFSPALRLGATHLLAVGIRAQKTENPLGRRPDQVGLGFVAGAVLNSIFLDSLEVDYENVLRINRIGKDTGNKKISAILIRPSQDLGAVSKDFLQDVPFHLRQLLKSTARPGELGDLLSYLMFSRGYVTALMELGYRDAQNRKQEIADALEA